MSREGDLVIHCSGAGKLHSENGSVYVGDFRGSAEEADDVYVGLFRLIDNETGAGAAFRAYEAILPDGTRVSGITNLRGELPIVTTNQPNSIVVRALEDEDGVK